jgi:Secretion system C-terminal sorting domain/Beta-propeller repeat
MRISLFITLLFLIPFLASSQTFQQWASQYNGDDDSQDFGRSFVLDNIGNAYVVGSSSGIGTGLDLTVIKYDSLGNEIWVTKYNGQDSLADWGYAIDIDANNNVYATGETATLSSSTDMITLKIDANGTIIWTQTYNGPNSDVAVDLVLDFSGNVYITGKSVGTTSSEDYLTIKYDNNGNEMWVQQYNGTGNSIDEARTIHADLNGDVIISGGSIGDTTDYDFVTIKYNSAGVPLWTSRYNGPGNGYDLVFYQGSLISDSLGNIYVCGYSTGLDSLYEYTLIKYNASGNEQWVARLGGDRMGKDDFTDAITIDAMLNVYITGAMYDSISNYDITTVKYDSLGVFQWEASYDGVDSDWDEGYGILVDEIGNVYVGGRSNKTGFSGADFVIIKYDPSGAELWNVLYARGGFSWPFKLRRDANKNLYIGGWSSVSSPALADITLVKFGFNQVFTNSYSQEKESILIWPNPSSGAVFFSGINETVTVTVFAIDGKKMLEKTVPLIDQRLDLDHLDSGIYVVRIKLSNQYISRRIIIQ